MPPIKHTALFDFPAYEQAIKDVKVSSVEFGKTMSDVIKRIGADQKELLDALRGYSALLKNLNVTQAGAADGLKKYATEIDNTTTNLTELKATQAGLAQIVNLSTASVKELKAEYSGLKKQYDNLKPSQKDYEERVQNIKKRINEVVPLIKSHNESLKVTKKAVDAVEGSYNKMQQQLTLLKNRLKEMPNAFDAVTGRFNKNNKEAVALQREIFRLDGALKNADATMGVFTRNVGNYSSAFNKIGSGISSIGLSLLALAGISSISSFIQSSIDEFLEADRASSQLKNTLEGLGRTDAFDRLTRAAQAMADRFKYLDNDEVVAVFNKLIDYGKLTEQQMNELLPVIVDFAAKSKLSIGDATDAILNSLTGKLSPEIKRMGISFKDAGSEGDRLNIIMTQMKHKVDGAAEAFQNSAEGGIAAARQEFKNLKEDIGNETIPVLNFLLRTWLDVMKGFRVGRDFINERLKGGTGWFKITLDEVTKNPSVQKEISQLAEGFVSSFQSTVKSVGNKKLVAGIQEKMIQNTRNQIIGFQAEMDALSKTAKRNDDLEIRRLLVSIESRKAALDSIDALMNKKTLGTSDDTNGDAGDAADKALNKLKASIAKQQALFEKAADLDIKTNELRLVQKEISETEFQTRKLQIIRDFVEKAIALENKLGKNADQEKILGFKQKAKEAEIDFSKFLADEFKKRKELSIKNLKEAKEEEKKIRDAEQVEIDKATQKLNDAIDGQFRRQIKVENDLFELQKARGDQSIIEQIKHLERIKKIKKRYAQDTADEEVEIERLKEERKKQIVEESLRLSQDLFSAFNEFQSALSDVRIQKLEVEKERELGLAGNNAAAREAIEKNFNKQINKEKAKQARLDKALGIFNAAINTAQAIIKMLANPGGIAGVVLSIAAGITGALQIAAIAARPIPQFKKGTKNAPAGLAEVSEEGFELVERNGKMYVTPKNRSIINLQGGEKIYSHHQSKKIIEDAMKAHDSGRITQSIFVQNKMAGEMQRGKEMEAVTIMAKAMQQGGMNEKTIEKAFKNAIREIPQNDTIWDERGIIKRQRKLNETITYLNNRFGN